MEHLQRRHRFSYDTFVVGVGSPWSSLCTQGSAGCRGTGKQLCLLPCPCSLAAVLRCFCVAGLRC